MTLNCEKINIKQGSKGEEVKELQTILKQKKYYTGKIDGDYGDLTVDAVKKLQKELGGLAPDGIFGPITCKKLKTTPSEDKYNYYHNGIYHGGPYWVSQGCNKMGQCTGYWCALCALRQQLSKFGIDNYSQAKLAQMAGTTTAGTSHQGIETAIAKVAKETGKKFKVIWKNFSDFGSTVKERFNNIGKLLIQKNVGIIWHTLYLNRYGHYETVQELNMNTLYALILNSLGSKCGGSSYCGRKEQRQFHELARNLRGISQKSICIIEMEA